MLLLVIIYNSIIIIVVISFDVSFYKCVVKRKAREGALAGCPYNIAGT